MVLNSRTKFRLISKYFVLTNLSNSFSDDDDDYDDLDDGAPPSDMEVIAIVYRFA